MGVILSDDVREILSELLSAANDNGTWCESAVVAGSAWHLTVAEDAEWEALLERAEVVLMRALDGKNLSPF